MRPRAPAPPVVYVLDDDSAVRTGLCRFFRAAGYEDRPCATVDELMSRLGGEGRACVLFDLSVAGLDPGALSGRLRERGATMPLIAISGRYDEHAGRDARAAGAALLFRKPVDGRALLDAIEWLTPVAARS